MLEVRTFGGLSLRLDGQVLKDMGSHKAEALLVYLVVQGGQHSRARLVTLLWPESTDKHASTSLRVVLSLLRRRLAGCLEVSRDTIGIKPGARITLDVSELEKKLAGGEIEGALQLYRGDFLEGFNIHDSAELEHWIVCEQERLRALLSDALNRSITAAIEAGDYKRARKLVNRWLAVDPLDERAYYQSILMHALGGERSAALEQYDRCREILRKDLGAEPSEELQDLHERIRRGDDPASLLPIIPANNLPAPQTSFIGRESELAKIVSLIRDPACRLLTLAGPGGSGKTRLAIQAAKESVHCFKDGTYFVPLENMDSAEYLIPAIARALEFTLDSFINGADLMTQLLDFLRQRSILLVLDGCEYLSGRAGDLPMILEHAPNVRALASSRQRLGLQSEWVFPVEGLPVPQTAEEMRSNGSAAVKLFRERAGQARADFQLSAIDYEPAVRICRLVEGMPLGIELAAAWTSVLSPREIAEEAGKSLDFLTSSISDMPDKHRSLRAVFEGSWSLLSEEQREIFCKLSIFCGGFDRQAAAQVAGADIEQLSALLNRSLLRRTEAGRFTMHNLLRQYAAEKLSQSGTLGRYIQDRFCHYYIDMLAHREADLMGTGMLKARDEIRLEMDNFRSAVSWASANWSEQPVRQMLGSLWSFYALQGWQEAVLAFRDIAQTRQAVLAAQGIADPSKDPVFLSARIHAAFFQCNLGQIAESEAISMECVQGLQQPGLEGELSECLQNLGVNASYRGEYERARELLEQAILLGRGCDHVAWPTYLLWLGNLYFQLGEYQQGLLSLEKCYELFDRRGTLWGTAFALSKMGMASDGLGDHARARRYHQEALAVFDRLESRAGKAYALARMSMSAYFLEDYAQAFQWGQEGYQAFSEIGHRWGICTSLCALGFASLGLGDTAKARGYFRNALGESRPDQIVPQSLYALIGLACCLAREGETDRPLRLLRFVRKHPETPSIYLEQAAPWIGNLEQAAIQNAKEQTATGEEIKTIDEVTGWFS